MTQLWLFSVQFARWSSPGSSSLECHIVAPTEVEAGPQAWIVARAKWGDAASDLGVLSISRVTHVDLVAPPPGGGR